jgi:hypothetical protein
MNLNPLLSRLHSTWHVLPWLGIIRLFSMGGGEITADTARRLVDAKDKYKRQR